MVDRADSELFDLLLKGGHVIDPANGMDAGMDVAIRDKEIALVAADVPTQQAAEVVDVAGLYVVPGIVDIHTHVYTFTPRAEAYVGCMDADAHLPASGVTTTVDAGTAGWRDFLDFKERNTFDILHSQTEIHTPAVQQTAQFLFKLILHKTDKIRQSKRRFEVAVVDRTDFHRVDHSVCFRDGLSETCHTADHIDPFRRN